MFTLRRPKSAEIDEPIAAARRLATDGPGLLSLTPGIPATSDHPGFKHDRSRSLLGHGETAFESAKRAFQRWAQFDLGWSRVANPDVAIAAGQIIAVEFETFALWTLNLSRIVEVVDTPGAFGFIYSTTGMHVERGEEQFLIEFDHAAGDVWYEIEALSRPRHFLARVGFPVARALQHRFVRESHRRMLTEVLAPESILS